jgi:hypothetical protein
VADVLTLIRFMLAPYPSRRDLVHHGGSEQPLNYS